jgi:hypothetical protein
LFKELHKHFCFLPLKVFVRRTAVFGISHGISRFLPLLYLFKIHIGNCCKTFSKPGIPPAGCAGKHIGFRPFLLFVIASVPHAVCLSVMIVIMIEIRDRSGFQGQVNAETGGRRCKIRHAVDKGFFKLIHSCQLHGPFDFDVRDKPAGVVFLFVFCAHCIKYPFFIITEIGDFCMFMNLGAILSEFTDNQF